MAWMVNGEEVPGLLVEQEFQLIKAHFERTSQVICCERDEEFRGYARNNVVARMLLTQEALRRFAATDDDELESAIAALQEEHGGEPALCAYLGLIPGEEALVRRTVDTNLRVDRLLREICGEEPVPSQADLLQYYRDHLEEFTPPEEVRACHIFKSFRNISDKEKLFRELSALRRDLVAGADFMDVARAHSDKPAEEIDLGFYRRGDLLDEFEFVTFSMNVGEVSPVFASQTGFHLAKVTDRKPPLPQPFETVRDQAKESWLAAWRDGQLKEFIEQLKGQARIEEVADPSEAASSANQGS